MAACCCCSETALIVGWLTQLQYWHWWYTSIHMHMHTQNLHYNAYVFRGFLSALLLTARTSLKQNVCIYTRAIMQCMAIEVNNGNRAPIYGCVPRAFTRFYWCFVWYGVQGLSVLQECITSIQHVNCSQHPDSKFTRQGWICSHFCWCSFQLPSLIAERKSSDT